MSPEIVTSNSRYSVVERKPFSSTLVGFPTSATIFLPVNNPAGCYANIVKFLLFKEEAALCILLLRLFADYSMVYAAVTALASSTLAESCWLTGSSELAGFYF